ncbi:GntR family transcriptional regulator [Agathobaculum sp. NTUH-O15-33]|uniref:GntR family transcriptional regulator n=1 Tax=Agathobaculum sp. NTUH-O15-33 TaxID=3079302 RepID=UPI002958613E|nr:GntR family transcriptional regulator [Agathobaculum sp. NTUH-O15-33]WNX84941.1 GntR family transcriptional regulator [Agathobaculum sp. NTUH-O15-33]
MSAGFKYIQLAGQLREEIYSGALKPGMRLYSEPKLAQMYSLSRQTVRQAITMLQEEGLVTRSRGSGTYVTDHFRPSQAPSNKNIGIIMTYVDDYIFPSILNGINSYLSTQNYTINLHITANKRIDEERILRSVLESPPDGLIIEPTKSGLVNTNQRLYDKLIRQIPSVMVNCYYPTVSCPAVMPDNIEGMKLAVENLIAHGHTRIAGVFKQDDLQGHLRFAGYANALQAHELSVNDDWLMWYATEEFDSVFSGPGEQTILRILRECTAVVCYNDQLALLFIRFLRAHGLSVPKDVSIVSFDDSMLSTVDVPLTSVVHPKQLVGQKAAQNLLQLIRDPTFKPGYQFPPILVERESVRDLT